jgi:hypothetical protein
MPTTPRKAKILLRDGMAQVVSITPFTIKLKYGSAGYKQNLILGIDTGSSKVGSAVVSENGDVLYMSQVEIRNDITKKMKRRAKYRRNRRNRKTRYRKAKWLNRANSIKTGRFSPTMRSKFDSHLKEIRFVKSILPINRTILETATFDPHALKNPKVLYNKWLYQKGINYGFSNTREYVLTRDSYKCQNCKGKSGDKRIEVHHIIFRSNGGSDDQDNLMTLCKTCHDEVHDGELFVTGGKRKGQLKHATQMNSIRTQLLKSLPEAEETFGFITKEHIWRLGLNKEHYFDAVVIACQGMPIQFKTSEVLFKRCMSDGDYQQTKGVRSEQKIPSGKIQGFRKFDKVEYQNTEYLIKGRMSSGYAILMDITGTKVNLKPMAKFDNMKRISARDSWIILPRTIVNSCL